MRRYFQSWVLPFAGFVHPNDCLSISRKKTQHFDKCHPNQAGEAVLDASSKAGCQPVGRVGVEERRRLWGRFSDWQGMCWFRGWWHLKIPMSSLSSPTMQQQAEASITLHFSGSWSISFHPRALIPQWQRGTGGCGSHTGAWSPHPLCAAVLGCLYRELTWMSG